MNCPKCGNNGLRVIDSRTVKSGRGVRRRRECFSCDYRFTTYEYIEKLELMIEKGNGVIEPYSRDKVRSGILRSCHKRPIKIEAVDKIVDKVYSSLTEKNKVLIESKEIGELVMHYLKDLDKIAYIRFASVYRRFEDVDQLLKEVANIKNS